jgi:uncharacterized protein (TIGR03435 family)
VEHRTKQVVLVRVDAGAAAPPLPAIRDGNGRFALASITRHASQDAGLLFQTLPGGRVTIRNYPLREIIRSVYQLQAYQLIGGPDWLTAERYDISATADGDPAPPQMLVMLRALLADRFGLAVHRETRELPVYALVRARANGTLGPKLKTAAVDCAARSADARAGTATSMAAADPACGVTVGPGAISAGGSPLGTLARGLSPFVGRPIVDRTGLSGRFDFELSFTPDPHAAPPMPNVFTALDEQLGLTLESDRTPIDVLVIDDVTRPTN